MSSPVWSKFCARSTRAENQPKKSSVPKNRYAAFCFDPIRRGRRPRRPNRRRRQFGMRKNMPIEVIFFRRVVEDADPYAGFCRIHQQGAAFCRPLGLFLISRRSRSRHQPRRHCRSCRRSWDRSRPGDRPACTSSRKRRRRPAAEPRWRP